MNRVIISCESWFNPFIPNAPFLYPLKTSENLTVEKGCLGNKWVYAFMINVDDNLTFNESLPQHLLRTKI